MTAVADLLSRRDRDRLAARLAEWRDLADTMRERVSLAPAPVPVPLHKMGAMQAATTTAGAKRP